MACSLEETYEIDIRVRFDALSEPYYHAFHASKELPT